MKLLLWVVSLVVLLPAAPASASWLEHFGGDLKATVIDPSEGGLHEFTLGTVAAAGAASLMSYEFIDDRLAERQSNPRLEGGSVWLSRVGEYLPYALPVGFFVASYWGENKSELQRTAEELTESLVLTVVTTFALKYTVQRRRPSSTEEASFPSAHSSMAFSSAGILALRCPWYVGVPSLLVATMVAVSRVDLGKHYVSDVTAGAGLGLLFSFAVHAYHEKLATTSPTTAQWIPTPILSPDLLGLAWNGKLP